MPTADLIIAGVQLMLLGMGIVFGFLILLVFVLKGMSRLAHLVEPPESVATSSNPSAVSPSRDQAPIPVIAAAIARYRAGRTR